MNNYLELASVLRKYTVNIALPTGKSTYLMTAIKLKYENNF